MYQDKIVLISGSSRGVGLAIAKHFISLNATVIGLSKGVSVYEHERYYHYSIDIANGEDIIKIFRKEIYKKFKRIDFVINNAALLTSQFSMIMPIKNATDMVNVNLLGVFFISREAAKLMRNNKYGRIINISSMAVSLEPIGDSVYAACKAGINTMANIMAKEFSTLHITCNTIGITAIETDMLNQLPRHKIEKIINKLTVPRYAQEDDIFNVIDFLVSERSSYITAQTIYLGGIN